MESKPLHNQRGTAMVAAMLALILLSTLGTLFIAQTKTETQISGHDQRANQALTHAEAGYAEVLARMSDDTDTANYIGEPFGTISPGWGRYVVLAPGNSSRDLDVNLTATDGLDNDGDSFIDNSGERYPEVGTRQGDDTINYPWAKVQYKLSSTNEVLLFGDHDNDLFTPPCPNLVQGSPIIVITTSGMQSSAQRMVEVEAIKMPFDLLAAAIYAENDAFKFNGTQFLISGEDWDPHTESRIVGNPQVPGIVTTERDDAIEGVLSGPQLDNVEGQGGVPSVTRGNVDLDLQAMADAYAELASTELPGGTYAYETYGDLDHYTVVHCTGDMHVSGNVSGGGILLVDGNFECSGAFTWYGLVLVMGDVTFTGGGSEIHIYGSLLTGGAGSGLQTVSGNSSILYSSIALAKLTALKPYTVSNWREL